MIFKSILITVGILCSYIQSGFSQSLEILKSNNSINENIKSPSAASLGEFGQIPVSYFNGTVQITIPLYEINHKGMKVPISLDYSTSGFKPDNSPGWVGLGWNLTAGGLITRLTNIEPDEYPMAGGWYQNYAGNYRASKGLLNTTNWQNQNFNFYDGPDEFVFNFLGMSGSFYLDHLGSWKIKSKDGIELQIREEIQSNLPVSNPDGSVTHLLSSYKKFSITGSDGTIYIFGDDQLQSIKIPNRLR